MKKIKAKVVYLIAKVAFFIRNVLPFRKLNIKNVDVTIDELIRTNRSLIRFGDGEIALMRGHDIRFQEYCEDLRNNLLSILRNNTDDIMIAIPDIYTFDSIKQYKKKDKKIWMKETLFSYPIYSHYKKITFYNSLVSRLYLQFDCDYEKTQERFNKIKMIWNDKKILIVEGQYSRLGVGNDLFSNIKSIHRIVCPEKNSYTKISSIENSIIEAHKEFSYDLTILALGPTAKIVIEHLHNIGRMLDFGHIDIEYEWFLRKATDKISINGKAVNEVIDGYDNLAISDSSYDSEIVKKII